MGKKGVWLHRPIITADGRSWSREQELEAGAPGSPGGALEKTTHAQQPRPSRPSRTRQRQSQLPLRSWGKSELMVNEDFSMV